MSPTVLRPATTADSGWCYRLHRAVMRDYVDAVRGWDDDVQQAFHERHFDPAGTRIIVHDGHDAGVLVTEYGPDTIYLKRIEIDPECQRRGIGSRVIGQLLREASDRGQPVELDVLVVNPGARALYRRLGFHDVTRHGDGNTKIRMRWTPL